MPLKLHLFDIDLVMWVTERKTTDVKCHSPIIIKGTCCHCDLSLWMLILIIWLRWLWLLQLTIRVLHCQLLPPPQPFHVVLFGRSHYVQPMLRKCGVMLLPLEGRVSA